MLAIINIFKYRLFQKDDTIVHTIYGNIALPYAIFGRFNFQKKRCQLAIVIWRCNTIAHFSLGVILKPILTAIEQTYQQTGNAEKF